MNNQTQSGATAPSLLTRAAAALFGSDSGTFLDRSSAFLADCNDPAALRRKADEYRDEMERIRKIRDRERPSPNFGMKTPDKWEDGTEAFNRLHELNLSAGNLIDKAARIDADAKWNERRASDAGRLKAELKDAAARKDVLREAAASAAGVYRRQVADRDLLEAKLGRIATRLVEARSARDAALERDAGELLADDEVSLTSGDVARHDAEIQTLERAQALGGKQLQEVRDTEARAKAEHEAAQRAWLTKAVEHASKRLELKECNDRELYEDLGALRLMLGLGMTPHRVAEIDPKAIEQRAAVLRAEFGE